MNSQENEIYHHKQAANTCDTKPLASILKKKNDKFLKRLKSINEDHHLHHSEELKLQSVSGIQNSSVLANAIDLGITAENLSAINLIPLIKVATADQKCDEKERDIILKLATDSGVEEESEAYELIQHWLDNGFNPNLTITWKNYLKTLKERMPECEYNELKRQVLKKCKKVAKASHTSMLGLGPISKKEQNAIRAIELSF